MGKDETTIELVTIRQGLWTNGVIGSVGVVNLRDLEFWRLNVSAIWNLCAWWKMVFRDLRNLLSLRTREHFSFILISKFKFKFIDQIRYNHTFLTQNVLTTVFANTTLTLLIYRFRIKITNKNYATQVLFIYRKFSV